MRQRMRVRYTATMDPIILERLELEMIKATEGNDFDSWEKEPVKVIG